jgi:hypothetical protein
MSSDGQQQSPTHNNIFLASVILLSIASYNVVEVLVCIASTFRRFRGLYYYSVLLTDISLGGFIGVSFSFHFTANPAIWTMVLWAVSHTTLTTAQVLVPYARLHLVLPHNPRLVRAVLVMIIVSSIVLLVPQVVCYIYTAISRNPDWGPSHRIAIIQRTISIAAVVREMAVCAIYAVQAFRELGTIAAQKGRDGKKILYQLIAVQIAVVLMDVALVANIFVAAAALQWGYSAAVCAIKLKMEFAILNTLKRLLTSPTSLPPCSRGTETGMQP